MKKKLIGGTFWVNFFVLWGILITPCMAAEKFPIKPITLLIGYSPGGSADMVARYLADFVHPILGQPVVVINREGGAGAVALGELKNAPADGYTLGYLPASGIISAHLRKLPYHPTQDFEPIIHHSDNIFGLVVRADSPFKTLKDLIVYAQANPEKVTYCTAGAGSSAHLTMMLLGEAANVKWTHVPFGGGSQAIAAQLGGHVTCGAQTAVFKPHVDAGRLRLLASLRERRIDSYPDIPTLMELGYKVVAPSLQGYAAPKGIPKERVQILHDAFRRGVESPGFKELLNKVNMEVHYLNPDDFRNKIEEVYEATGKIIEKSGADLKKK